MLWLAFCVCRYFHSCSTGVCGHYIRDARSGRMRTGADAGLARLDGVSGRGDRARHKHGMANRRQFQQYMPLRMVALFRGGHFWKMPQDVEVNVGRWSVIRFRAFTSMRREKQQPGRKLRHRPQAVEGVVSGAAAHQGSCNRVCARPRYLNRMGRPEPSKSTSTQHLVLSTDTTIARLPKRRRRLRIGPSTAWRLALASFDAGDG